jgi:arginine/lysine/histidine transporter system substrate-binding protein
MKKLFGFGLVVLGIIGLAGCNVSNENIVVLTSSGYEPYEMIDEQGNLIGFDIDLMNAIAEELGWTIEWRDVDFDGILASLQTGQADMAIAGISPTSQRALTVDFSEVYYSSIDGLLNFLVTNNPSIQGLEDLEGLTIGTQLGTIQQEFMEALAEEFGFTVVTRNQNAQIIEEIKNGLVDALVVENLVADSIIAANAGFSKVLVEQTLDDVYGNAIAFPKGSVNVTLVNEALQTLKDNGTLDALIAKWFNE